MSGVVETLRDIDHSKWYLKIWYLWFNQNLLLFVSTFLYIAGYFSAFFYMIADFPPNPYLALRFILNITVFVALLLDLVVIAVISIISLLKGWDTWRKSQKEILSFIITGCGFMWIITSLIWRFPYYLRGPFEFGFDPMGPFTMTTLHNGEDEFLLFFMGGSIFLFVFLALQDRYFLLPERVSHGRLLYGFTIFIGNLSITIYGLLHRFSPEVFIIDRLNLTSFYWMFMLLWKLAVTSLIGMIVARRIFKASTNPRLV
ncbi:MAG: hypothetical protein ACFFB5_22925 [Promethearchaeota archaeon]